MIDKAAIKDLELDKVKYIISSYCHTDKGRELSTHIRPYTHYGALQTELRQTSEYLGALTSANNLPNLDFSPIDYQIKLLEVDNSYLTTEGLVDVANVSRSVNELIDFLTQFEEYYPSLKSKLKYVYQTTGIVDPIEKIIDIHGEIKDDATPRLREIRATISRIRGSIDRQFNIEMAHYRSQGLLNEINESSIDHHRVLAVEAMHRKKVRGSSIGTSKTGSIVFIEPESTVRLSNELSQAQGDEKEEIILILKACTEQIRPYTELLVSSQTLLTQMDLLQAKAQYALEIDACLPTINKNFTTDIKQAYHPLLLYQNKADNRETFPQDIFFSPLQRIIAISGPNAGGKSITLKTIGLLQVMLQCGILVPVHPKSTMCFYENIITDIGDNQSIENHLSTYSYRLKNMASFLKVCNSKTLFLIDEFGTGSDPDLGGALAAVFLEEFYSRGAYGVLTTHYINIKLMVENLPEAINASMLFDQKTLRPLYKLFVGQAGSSFTFEVAQANGISKDLIERAKTRVQHDKIVLDRTIASLQKEKSNIVEQSKNLSSARKKADTHAQELEKANEKLLTKLESYQRLYDRNTKRIQLGQRIETLADAYFFKKQSKKDILASISKIIEVENSRKAERVKELVAKSTPQPPTSVRQTPEQDEKQAEKVLKKQKKILENILKTELEEQNKTEQLIQVEIEPIREQVAIQEEQRRQVSNSPTLPLGIGDRVRLVGGFSVGSIEKIIKGIAHIDYGWFITQVKVEELELVERRRS